MTSSRKSFLPPIDDATAVRKRLIETARPELIQETLALLNLRTVPSAIAPGVVAYALARCGADPSRVVELRHRWLDLETDDSFLVFVDRETRR
jgi:hypothetical protein